MLLERYMKNILTKYLNKYAIILKKSIKHQVQNRQQLVGRILLYSLIVYLFSQVFVTVTQNQQRIWYFAVTQLISLSAVPITFLIMRDVRSKKFDYFLLRPIDYLFYRFTEAFGASLINYALLIICLLILCFSLTFNYPSFTNLVVGLFFGLLSICLYLLITILIGFLVFYIKDVKNLFYLNLTASFCFGGLIVPIEYYSPLMKKICFYTPYPWILWCSGQLVNGNIAFTRSLSCWGGWVLLLLICLFFLRKNCLKLYLLEG